MTRRLRRSFVVALCALTCASGAVRSLWQPAGYVRTEDWNGDGRPDVWHTYNRLGQLSDVTVDTNFDGRSDVHEYYERGALVRRESDRDFNDRVDLVQEFDPTTREHARSVVDVDFDGTADLLVLFQDGKPVFLKWAHPVAPAQVSAGWPPHRSAFSRTPINQPAALEDPFSDDLAVSAVRIAAGSDDFVGLSTSGGLPASQTAIASPLAFSSDASGSSFAAPPSPSVFQYSPRGPPLSHLSS